MDVDAFRVLHPMLYTSQFLEKGYRTDGRTYTEQRDISIARGLIGTANGSAFVRLGDSKVLTAIQPVITIPTEKAPKQGIIEINVNLSPISSPQFRTGKTEDESLSVSQFLTRSIVDSNTIDLESLCIKPGKAVWSLKAEVICTDYSGNIEDVAVLSLVSALSNTVIPASKLNSDGKVTASPNLAEASRVQMRHFPLPLSFALVSGHLLVDPTREELDLSSALICIVSTVEGVVCQLKCLCSEGNVSDEIIEQCFAHSKQNLQRIYSVLQDSPNPLSLPGT
eukprot:gb/GECG01009223.1/.p1 GENE.gb/GECG01009223.1/~~gb/GECG01009223.1/.p1  ORF type:complete len:281 (+),score=22.94 gb/GECG01009223.1/:1-843(+)